MTGFRTGVRIGIDVGKARIGVSRSDLHGMLATPVETVARDHSGDADLARLRAIIDEADAFEVIVGLPLSLSGAHTPSTDDAVDFATRLADRIDTPVRLVDERLSTVSAHSALHSSGRTHKGSRKIVDQVAAVIILQHAMDAEKTTLTPPGTLVESPPEL
ncbi:Holliday junction resolvase RuvX [Paramicrobacterium sp. CJ85]|uniref:Holliday junction resolvase RuvX n=1 Tax=Paramicrobacterium sp. CJ85 TaxID=3445355 RepID=UPI003F5EAFD8